jgi:hypothetical protein
VPDYSLYIFLGFFVGLVFFAAFLLRPYMPHGYFGRCLRRAISLRLGCSAGCLGIIVIMILAGVLGYVGLDYDVGGYLGLACGALLWAALVLSDKVVLDCPHCQSRVNAGARVCHRCGRDVHT